MIWLYCRNPMSHHLELVPGARRGSLHEVRRHGNQMMCLWLRCSESSYSLFPSRAWRLTDRATKWRVSTSSPSTPSASWLWIATAPGSPRRTSESPRCLMVSLGKKKLSLTLASCVSLLRVKIRICLRFYDQFLLIRTQYVQVHVKWVVWLSGRNEVTNDARMSFYISGGFERRLFPCPFKCNDCSG